MKSWLFLGLAGIFEIGWAVGLKYSDGLTRLVPSLGTLVALIFSMTLLGLALKDLPLGTAYGIWTGIGTLGTFICGIALFGDAASAGRMVFAGFILIGIIGLKLTA